MSEQELEVTETELDENQDAVAVAGEESEVESAAPDSIDDSSEKFKPLKLTPTLAMKIPTPTGKPT